MLTSDNQQRMDFCEVAANQMGQIGINCNVDIMEWGAYLDAIFEGKHEMTVLGFSYGADPVIGFKSVFHSESFGTNGNISWYSNPRVDELINNSLTEMDSTKRRSMVEEIQQIIVDDAVWVNIWQGENLTGTIKDLKGYQLYPNSQDHLQDTYMD